MWNTTATMWDVSAIVRFAAVSAQADTATMWAVADDAQDVVANMQTVREFAQDVQPLCGMM